MTTAALPPRPTFFGAIADDFTGATDLASLIARSGVPVSLRIGLPEEPPATAGEFEIIALKCRTAPKPLAIKEALSAFAWLLEAGAQRFFWKYCSTFDSTPDGNIGPVAEALMDALGVDQTIYCPAFPENGRSIFMGHLFVGEQLLSDSPMKDHPLTPMRDSSLLRLLRPQVGGQVGLVNRLAVEQGPDAVRDRLRALDQERVAHVIVDAVSNDDLQVIAEACGDMPLLTGGSALAMPLPALWRSQGLLKTGVTRTVTQAPPGGAIILSGSCSAMTNRQVARYLADGHPGFRLDPLALLQDGAKPALAWLEIQAAETRPIIYATAEPAIVKDIQNKLGVEQAGRLVENALAEIALKALQGGRRSFVVAGGETSGAVAKALGVSRLDIGPDIAPGVPWCHAVAHGQPIAITLKSGNFGGERFFDDAFERLS